MKKNTLIQNTPYLQTNKFITKQNLHVLSYTINGFRSIEEELNSVMVKEPKLLLSRQIYNLLMHIFISIPKTSILEEAQFCRNSI